MVVEKVNELLGFFKALGDANRLKIVGLLAQDDRTVEELAAMLEVRSSTVSHHLGHLSRAGLVSARAESYYSIYSLDLDRLTEMSQRLLSEETLKAQIEDVDLDAYDRKVVETFMGDDGRFESLPAQYKKLKAVLRYVVRDFEPGTRYPESRVNEILGGHHEDTARLRRELVEAGMMEREGGGGDYWRAEEPSP